MKVGRRNPAWATRRIKEMGFGQGPGAGEGRVPLVAKFPGQRAEPDDGKGAGHFAAQGVDATSQVVHSVKVLLRGLLGIFRLTGHFRPFPAIFSRSGCWRDGMGITNGEGSFMGI